MGFVGPLVVIAVLLSTGLTQAGPCTAQIGQIEQQINAGNMNAPEGPSAPQTIGAQLGRQPTPATVGSAERQAGDLARAALDNARKADDAGDAVACRDALAKFKDLYGLP